MQVNTSRNKPRCNFWIWLEVLTIWFPASQQNLFFTVYLHRITLEQSSGEGCTSLVHDIGLLNLGIFYTDTVQNNKRAEESYFICIDIHMHIFLSHP